MVAQRTLLRLQKRIKRSLTPAEAYGALKPNGRRNKQGLLRADRGVTAGALSEDEVHRVRAARQANSTFKVAYTFQGYAFRSLAAVANFIQAKDEAQAQANAQAAEELALAAAAPCMFADCSVCVGHDRQLVSIFYERSGVFPCKRCKATLFSENCACCRAQMGWADAPGKPAACELCLDLLGK